MRICVDFSLSMIVMLYAQFMEGNNPGEAVAEDVIYVKTAVLNGKSALMFHSSKKERYAWAVWDDSVPAFLVWFSKAEDVLSIKEGNLYPDPKECESAYVMMMTNVTNVINDYITKDVKPLHVMPRGHLQETSGFNKLNRIDIRSIDMLWPLNGA